MKFIDTAEIHVKAGDGGVGCVSFRREKFVPRGGPNGGDGGRGGDVIVRGNQQLHTLLDFQYKRVYKADRGEHGLGALKTGKSGKTILLQVPVGTVIRDASTGDTVADFVDDGQEIVLVRGGRGGRGNAAFATSTNQAPRRFEHGEAGEERVLSLELKLLADVGLVGFPNAGKSTLISVVSAARPKIADYPFTTLVPNLGIVRMETGRHFVIADIPGLVEGAHHGKGLGLQFLRHIERTHVLVSLIDATSHDPAADYQVLVNELRLFNRALTRKPRIVALTKADLLSGEMQKTLLRLSFPMSKGRKDPRVPTYLISAVSGQGIKSLLDAIWSALHGPAGTRVRRKKRTEAA